MTLCGFVSQFIYCCLFVCLNLENRFSFFSLFFFLNNNNYDYDYNFWLLLAVWHRNVVGPDRKPKVSYMMHTLSLFVGSLSCERNIFARLVAFNKFLQFFFPLNSHPLFRLPLCLFSLDGQNALARLWVLSSKFSGPTLQPYRSKGKNIFSLFFGDFATVFRSVDCAIKREREKDIWVKEIRWFIVALIEVTTN